MSWSVSGPPMMGELVPHTSLPSSAPALPVALKGVWEEEALARKSFLKLETSADEVIVVVAARLDAALLKGWHGAALICASLSSEVKSEIRTLMLPKITSRFSLDYGHKKVVVNLKLLNLSTRMLLAVKRRCIYDKWWAVTNCWENVRILTICSNTWKTFTK